MNWPCGRAGFDHNHHDPVLAEIDASQADPRLIGMPIYTYDGVLIGRVAGGEVIGPPGRRWSPIWPRRSVSDFTENSHVPLFLGQTRKKIT